MASTSIEWATDVWNPTTGCDQVSPGCDNCYALTMAKRLKGMGSAKYQNDGDPKTSGPGFGAAMHPDALTLPLSWRKPRRVFVNSMSDLFHEKFTDEFIARVFAVMAACPQHTFQILTKRHARMRSLLNRGRVGTVGFFDDVEEAMGDYTHAGPVAWPLPNVWLGVSTETQQWADIRIPALLDTPAAVRWISAEPLLGRIDLDIADIHAGHESDDVNGAPHLLTCLTCSAEEDDDVEYVRRDMSAPGHPKLDWVVVGGESGPGARPMDPDWARSLRDQCAAAGVPFLFKQWGAHNVFGDRVGKGRAGRVLDGRTWDEYPAEASA